MPYVFDKFCRVFLEFLNYLLKIQMLLNFATCLGFDDCFSEFAKMEFRPLDGITSEHLRTLRTQIDFYHFALYQVDILR